MNKKYIDFYKKFILQTKTLNDGGIRKGFSVDQDQSEKESFPTCPHKNI